LKITNVLFLCTGNSARSILAEAILNREGAGRFQAYSAGSHTKGAVHPQTLKLLAELDHAPGLYRSKSWEEFATPGAPQLDVIITVCDNAAGETCPIWPGRPAVAHWGIPDPAAVEGDGQVEAFRDAYEALQRRIGKFLRLPFDSLEEAGLKARLREIGEMDDDYAR
jgi:protein-tyrosine-phosphatase